MEEKDENEDREDIEEDSHQGMGKGSKGMMGGKHRGMCGHGPHGMMGHCGHLGFRGLKYLILKVAKEKEISGSQIISIVNEITEGRMKPSPGNVYPALKELESLGYLKKREEDNTKYYSITDKGIDLLKDSELPIWYKLKGNMDSQTSEYLNKYAISSELDKLQYEATYLQESSAVIKADEELSKKVKDIIKRLSSITES